MDESLLLHEEILLLALRDEEGTIEFGTSYRSAIGGAALAELLMDGRIRIEGEKRKARVRSTGARQLKNEYLEECAVAVRTSKRLRSPRDWILRFANAKDLKHRVAQSLCDRGVLREEHDRVLGIFPRKVYPQADGRVEEAIVERMRAAIFSESPEVEPRTTVLISLANATGLLKPIFGKRELAGRKSRIERLVAGELAGRATREAIEALQATLAVAVLVPVIVT